MDIVVRAACAVVAAALTLTGGPAARPAALPHDSSGGPADELIDDGVVALEALVTAPDTCTVRDAADGDAENGHQLPIVFCDDGLPAASGGDGGIPVPVAYRPDPAGDDYTGLPPPASADEAAAADARYDLRPDDGRRITLDVDITLPAGAPAPAARRVPRWSRRASPPGGFPVVVFMHGCCSGNKTSWEAGTIYEARERWHHSNAWFAARGYIVVTYTARGFRNAEERGSTGTMQLNSRRFEINDYQYLVGLMADSDARRRARGQTPIFNVNPRKVAVVGGSYGGGFAWLALTDPTWRSPGARVPMRLAAVVAKYGWTDLLESLLPSGHEWDADPRDRSRNFVAPSDPRRARSLSPIGVEKQSIVAGLFGTGNNRSGNHTTFPDYVAEAYVRLQKGDPYEADAAFVEIARALVEDRSAYYQTSFWRRVRRGLEIPVYSAGTWTDPLFPTMEHLRFAHKLTRLNPDYPITSYYGDYQHFTQNKATEWADLCGADHHVCGPDDYRAPNFVRPATRVRAGINSRIDAFLRHHLTGKGRRPASSVSATTTICSSNASERYPADEPGVEYRAPAWRALTRGARTFSWDRGGTITSAAADLHAPESDPVVRDRSDEKCFITPQTDPGPGVVQVVGEEIGSSFTLLGLPVLSLELDASATVYWIAGRLFDLAPDGRMTLVARGVCKVNTDAAPRAGCEDFQLWGNGWRFERGHRVVLELSSSDQPMFRRSNIPSTISVGRVHLRLPVADPRRAHDFRD